jgi:hypothetical protein
MVASSNQRVMDTQKVELRALSDDQLDAVSGGDDISKRNQINQQENLIKTQDNYQQLQAMKIFAQALEGGI